MLLNINSKTLCSLESVFYINRVIRGCADYVRLLLVTNHLAKGPAGPQPSSSVSNKYMTSRITLKLQNLYSLI